MSSIETEPDIRNALTPLSLGGQLHAPRALWKKSQPSPWSSSTPIESESPRRRQQPHCLDSSYLIGESPILTLKPRLNLAAAPIFGRKDSLNRNSFGTSGVAATLGKMELCDNNNEINDKNMHNLKTDVIKEKDEEESTSSFHAHKQFAEQINKNKKKKIMTPKRKSPKVYKIDRGKKVLGSEGTTKKSTTASKKVTPGEKENKKKIKSPKSKKSPQDDKITSTKKIVSNSKVTKCPKTPKLQTAARAKLKQYKEEIRKQKEKEMEPLKAKQLEEQKRLEELEIMKLRQQTVFKAKPIRKYQPLPSVKKRALTDPISPNISKKRRIESSSLTSHSSNSNHTGNNDK